MRPKLLLIEDNDADAQLAIQSLTEAGEEFDYTHVRRLGDAMWELEATPPRIYQKIYLDLGLSEVKGQATAVIETLAKYVGGRENIIAVSAHPQSGTSQTIRARGTEVLGREAIQGDQGLLASLFFTSQQANHEKSVARHRELARLEIQIVRLEQKLENCGENFESRTTRSSRDLDEIRGEIKAYKEEFIFLKDRMDALELIMTNSNALKLKRIEVRWQLIVTSLSAIGVLAAAVLPKLLEIMTPKK